MSDLDKELALAIDFKKAPADLQLRATEHYTNAKQVAKLKKKVQDSIAELAEAEKIAGESAKVLRAELRRWEPEV